MKTIIYFLLFFLGFGMKIHAQHENDNWVFGNSKWNFDNSVPNGFSHVVNANPYIRYAPSVISDKNTGDLLFYCDGYTIYNKNNVAMDNGNGLFGAVNPGFAINPSDQSSIIVPKPNSGNLYYVFYINGNRTTTDYDVLFSNTSYNYGLRYAIVDMSLNNGLGKVISKNNVLFSNSPTNALTATFGSGGSSFWIVTANNGNFLSYKLDAGGLNTTPVVSPGSGYGNFIKISPNAQKLLTRTSGVMLYDFNNVTGAVTNPVNIIPNNNYAGYYQDDAGTPNSAEFSPNSEIVYFISAEACLCQYPQGLISSSGISMYNISTGSLVGVDPFYQYQHPLPSGGFSGSLQRAQNGKIYLIYNVKIQDDGFGYKEVRFGNYVNGVYYSYNWGVINAPDTWNPGVNPLSGIASQAGTRNGFSFPQLVPSAVSSGSGCVSDILLNTPELNAAYTYQASNEIVTKDDYTVFPQQDITMKAGKSIALWPNTFIMAGATYLAKVEGCEPPAGQEAERKSRESILTSWNTDKSPKREDDIILYPNPASAFATIDTRKEKLLYWEMYDMSGKLMLKGNSTRIGVEGLPQNTYLLRIVTANGKSVHRSLMVR